MTAQGKYKFVPHRADKNQPSIVATFRKLGCMVQHLHRVGEGVFDLLVAVDWLVISVEVKDGSKMPSKRSLTPEQKRWNFAWTGLRAVVTSDHEARCLVYSARMIVAAVHAAKINPEITGCAEAMYLPLLF